jgi:D-arabinose 5-phosphate isomerase GutQ
VCSPRQVEALGESGDVAFGITTSGGSTNVIEAFRVAKARQLTTIALTGRDGGDAGRMADITSTCLIRLRRAPRKCIARCCTRSARLWKADCRKLPEPKLGPATARDAK